MASWGDYFGFHADLGKNHGPRDVVADRGTQHLQYDERSFLCAKKGLHAISLSPGKGESWHAAANDRRSLWSLLSDGNTVRYQGEVLRREGGQNHHHAKARKLVGNDSEAPKFHAPSGLFFPVSGLGRG